MQRHSNRCERPEHGVTLRVELHNLGGRGVGEPGSSRSEGPEASWGGGQLPRVWVGLPEGHTWWKRWVGI